jgi:hypothetical protein
VIGDRLAVPLLGGWTVFLWASRIRNVLIADELSAGGQTWRIVVALVFLVLGGAVLWAWHDRRDEPVRSKWALGTLCVWTVGFWIVRGGGIIVDDHTLGFTLIHTVLMILSIGLAGWAWPRRIPAPTVLDTTV